MTYTDEDLERFRSYESVHLRGIDTGLPPGKKIKALRKKDRNKWVMLVFNFLAIIFFTYSYYFDLTSLGNTVYVILLVVFTLNVGLIFLQKRQIRELIEFYESQ